MFIEKKTIHGKIYLYVRKSFREGAQVKTKTIAYLGKAPMRKAIVLKKMAVFQAAESPALQKATALAYLEAAQLQNLAEMKQDFTRKLKTLDPLLRQEMFRDFKTYYIYNTNAIEGNTLTLEETNLLLNENKTPEGKDLREIYDHLNEKEVFDYLLKTKPDLTLPVIVDIHARLLKKIDARLGGFRRHNVRVVGAEFTPSPAEYVSTDMKILLRWYQQYEKNEKKLHPLILAALFHEKFERIHPFYDGNGRAGRMLLNFILLRKGYPPIIIKNKVRKEYYHALSQGHQAGLTSIEAEYYREIVQFCYTQLKETFQQIFAKWG